MLRISALNEELSDESSECDEPFKEKPTKEAEEADALSLYKEALVLRQKDDHETALKLFHQTLALPCIESALGFNDEKTDPQDEFGPSPSQQIKYACLKNIGALYGLKGCLEDALEAYLEAVEVDPLDVTVWYSIGKFSIELKNFQLARHAFLQGLTCSPNHWPCLDELISVLFGIGDDAACLFYINQALERDPDYIKGLVLRDSIFEDIPCIKEDIRSFPNESWNPLFETCVYTESEKMEYLQEARALRDAVSGQYRHTTLPTVSIARKAESYTWTELGQSLVATYKWILTHEEFKLSCPVDLESAIRSDEVAEPPSKADPVAEAPSDVVEEMEVDDEEPEARTSPSDQPKEASIEKSTLKSSSSEEANKPETDAPTVEAKPDTLPLAETSKRKRSREETAGAVSDKENLQRRSTRSRAYAEQAEEDIYSLRAELRSFLPTSLLLDDFSEEKKDVDPAVEPVDRERPEAKQAVTSFAVDEEREVTDFLKDGQSAKYGILELLNRFCSLVAKHDENDWPVDLSHIFKEAYQIVRSHFALSDAFRIEEQLNDFSRLRPTLNHAEILISVIKSDPLIEIPSWFMEDLTVLFQVADETDWCSPTDIVFQARVFWLHCKWHSQSGRVQVAVSYLNMVERCFVSREGLSIHTQAIESPAVFDFPTVQEMEDVLSRTMALEDVERLYEEKKFHQLVSILKATFGVHHSSKAASNSQEYRVPVNRPTQLEMLLDGLSNLEDYDQYLIWGELSLDESINTYLAAFNRKAADEAAADPFSADWARVVERTATELEGILRCKRTSLGILDRRSLMRLTENLVHVLSHQLEAPDTSSKIPLNSTVYWILLHRIMEYEENRQAVAKREVKAKAVANADADAATEEAQEEEEDDADQPLPCSTLFLISAHDLLGKRSWCMHRGLFVPYVLEVLMRKRRNTNDFEDREELGRAIEQASYCALGYPTSKKVKNRYMADHSGTPVPYTWNLVLLLAEFYLPCREELPEFDTVKSTSNAEQEMLLQKIVSLIPSELDPKNKLEDVQDFIQGRRPNIPDYLKHSGMPREAENVFYLLGDYYFKNKEWAKAIENYMLDLALVPDRFDSWAALALATGSRLETKLNSCERLKNIGVFFDRAEAALRCFRRALRLRPLQTTLWIEQGTTAYMLHSFCSQLLRNETDSLSIEQFERVEKERERMLDIAHDCFVAADKAWLTDMEKGNGDDERWLHHYMLGKVAEKRSRPLDEFVDHYQRAAKLLEEASAAYPKRISYNTPAQLSVEALEVYYRIHSNCLKSLMTLEGRPPDSALSSVIYKQLQVAAKGFFAQGGRRSSVEQKEDAADKEGVKRKASKQEDERAAKKCAVDLGNEKPSVPLEGRAAAIFDVNFILNEILEKVVQTAKPQRDGFFAEEETPSTQVEEKPASIPADVAPSSKAEEAAQSSVPVSTTSSSSSSSSDSSSSDSDSESSSDGEMKEGDDVQEKEPEKVEEPPAPAPPPTPDIQVMVDMCLAAIKECVSRFPHFYKGLYRMAHYYYHSKANRNIEACRELLFGRALSASIAQMQQQQGVVQVRFLPVGVAGLFTEWRSNNFFHGIWRIPINEIDRPGCFAAHMGRSAALLLEVLRETRDHRLLMELALALQPEPEPDKKYLFDSEREQHASLALSLTQKVLRSRLQEIKDAPVNTADVNVSPQQGSPSSSKKLSLLMDAFRAHDRIERNLPGKETAFAALLIDSYKIYRNAREQNESDASLMEQALAFCRNKQAQSRVRVGGGRGGMASLGVVSTRGKRGYGTGRRGRQAGVGRMPSVRDHSTPLSLSALSSTSTAAVPPAPDSASVMQEAMRLLQSAGGSAANLPQHLRNIPGISNLLAMFSAPATSSKSSPSTSAAPSSSSASSVPPPPLPPPPKAVPKKDPPAPKPAPSTSAAAQPASSSSLSDPLSQAFAGMGALPSLAALGAIDPTMLAMLSNPYLNPLSMFGGSDPSAMSKMQNDYQQQLMSWMQSTLAQSYVMSGMNPSFFPTRGRGRGTAKKSSTSSSSGRPLPKAPGASAVASSKPSSVTSASSSTTAMRTISADSSSSNKQSTSASRPAEKDKELSKSSGNVQEAIAGNNKLPIDLKLPLPQFDSLKTGKPSPQVTSGKSKTSSSNFPQKLSVPHGSSSKSSSAMTLPSVDVGKLLASLPPSLDLSRFAKMDPRTSGKSTGSSLTLGPDITVTATSSSSKPKIAHSSSMPSSSSSSSAVSGSSNKSKLQPPFVSSSGTSGFLSVPSSSLLSLPTMSSGRQSSSDLNIAFSVLQNLPSSMSFLVKPQPAHASSKASSSNVPLDLASSRPTQHQHSSALPKLTPAPGIHPHGFMRKAKPVLPGPPLPSLKSAGLPPPPFPNLPSSTTLSLSQGTQQRPSSSSTLRQSTVKEGKKASGDSGEDSDVVVLD